MSQPNAVTQNYTRSYWIIVSDEGTSSKPTKHETYDSAYTESFRLSKLKPGINFTIFKSIGNTFTEKPVEPKSTHTTYVEDSTWSWAPSYPYQYYKYSFGNAQQL